jgi:PAS domain S-box-containing protein
MVSFLGLSGLALAVVGYLAYSTTRDGITEAALGQLRAASALKAGELNRWIRDELELLEIVAALPGVRSAVTGLPAPEAVSRLRSVAADVLGQGRDFREVFFMAAEGGRVVASSREDRVGEFHASALFFRQGMLGPTVQEVYPSPETGRPRLTLAVPVRDARGGVGGLVAAHLNLDRLDAIISHPLGIYEEEQSYLVTGTNEFVSGRQFGLSEYDRGVHSLGIRRAVSGSTGGATYRDYRGAPVLGAYRWIPERGLALLVEVSRKEAFAPARGVLIRTLLFGLGAIFLLMVGIRIIASRVSRPVVAVARAAGKVAEGDFSAKAPVHGKDEIAGLAAAFNTMTERLRGLYANLEDQIQVTTRTMEALEESRSLLRAIVENSAALIAVTDLEGNIRLTNRALLDLLEIPEADAIGRKVGDLLPGGLQGECAAARARAFRKDEVVEQEIVWPVPDEEDRFFLCIWFPLRGEGEPEPFGQGLIATDLTERKRAEEDRHRLEVQMEQAQKLESLGILAGGIAHDFNNILAAILGHGTLAAEGLEDDPAEATTHLEQVLAAAERAADLTNQMLAYAGRASFRVETLDLNRSIREMSSFMAVSLPKKVRLEMDLSTEPLRVKADPAQLSQVVMNLITNGAQAMGQEAGIVEISTRPSLSVGGDPRAVLRVRDTGRGMDPATRERIFEPFFSTKEEGRGLGLAAVMGIVKGLGGTIEVESEPGKGTSLTVSLPMETGGEKKAVPPPTLRLGAASGTETLLVVDDEEAVRTFAKRALQRQGFDVLEAEDGVAALEAYEENADRIAAVVLDLSMPGLGGEEVFRTLRSRNPDLRILFTSGYDPSDAASSIVGKEGVRFLQKPYRPKVLIRELRLLLEGGAPGGRQPDRE